MMPVFDYHGNQLSGSTKGILAGGGGRGDSVRLGILVVGYTTLHNISFNSGIYASAQVLK